MADEPLWGIVGTGSGATAIALLFGIWDRFFRQKKEAVDVAKSDKDHMLTYLDERGKGTLERMDRDLCRCNEDVVRERTRSAALQVELDAMREDRDQGWDVARDWRVRCFAVWHELDNARTMVDGDREGAGKPAVEWFPEVLPGLEEIRADNARRAAEKRTWKGQARLPDL